MTDEDQHRSWIGLNVEFALSDAAEKLRREGPTPEAMEALFRALGIGNPDPPPAYDPNPPPAEYDPSAFEVLKPLLDAQRPSPGPRIFGR